MLIDPRIYVENRLHTSRNFSRRFLGRIPKWANVDTDDIFTIVKNGAASSSPLEPEIDQCGIALCHLKYRT